MAVVSRRFSGSIVDMEPASVSSRLHWAAAIILSIAALLGPAIWNGFPLIFADTGGYLERAFDGTLELGRSALYGTFLAAGIPLQFWPNILIQAALTLWILALVLRVHRLGGSCSFGLADRWLIGADKPALVCRTTDARHLLATRGPWALFARILPRIIDAMGNRSARRTSLPLQSPSI